MYLLHFCANIYLVIKMKKFLSVIISSLLLLSFFSFMSFAEDPVTFTITDEQVYAGDEITLHLYVSGNSNISGATVDINYDDSKLEFISAKEGAILDPKANISIRNINKDSSYVRFTYLSASSSIISEGILMSVTFKALESASGDAELKLTIPEPGDLVDSNLTKLSYNVNNSVVTIINDSVVEAETSTTELITENTTEVVEKSEISDHIENDVVNNNLNIILISALLIGLIFVIIGIVVFKKNEKS